jgi:hypothetical protein
MQAVLLRIRHIQNRENYVHIVLLSHINNAVVLDSDSRTLQALSYGRTNHQKLYNHALRESPHAKNMIRIISDPAVATVCTLCKIRQDGDLTS